MCSHFLIQKDWYKWSLEKLRQLHAKSDHEDAEIQVSDSETFFGAIPASIFPRLRIKEQARLPGLCGFTGKRLAGLHSHKAAFDRIGGHESTWCF